MVGKTIGHYEIREKIGAGGMGEVYRAFDRQLGREVALKLLPPSLSGDPERLARFRREARMLAALSHPNIVTIHSIEAGENPPFLTMELVAGRTLAGTVPPAGYDLDSWLDLARQIADAVAAANERGIVHRDLKPSNVILDDRGRIRVLDFGLAKSVRVAGPESQAETVDGTRVGRVVGTRAYMSPEQARGEPVGERSDVYSLGVLLYELAAGTRPFEGRTEAEAFASLLRDPPRQIRTRRPDFPDELDRLVLRCLEKDAGGRPSSAELLRELRDYRPPGRETPAQAPPATLTQVTFADALEGSPAWSPDGRELAFVREVDAVRKVFRQRIDAGEAEQLTRGPFDDQQVAWSPDGRTILFVRAREPGRRLEPSDPFAWHSDGDVWGLDLATRRESRVLDNAFNPAFSPDGARIAVDASWAGPRRLWAVDARGKNPEPLTSDDSDAVAHVRPRWAPDGRRLVFQSIERTQFDIRGVDLSRRELFWLTRDLPQDVNPVWSPSGRFVYFSSHRSGGVNIWRIPVGERGRAGSPQQLTNGAGQDVESAISPDGKRLAFVILRQNADLWRLPLDPSTGRPSGPPEKVIATTREESRGAWSPDGRRIAFNSDRTGDMNLWIHDLDLRSTRQLTRGPGGDYQPAWSPDGQALAFFSSRAGRPGIWTIDLGSNELSSLSPADAIEINPSFSPDGTKIAYQSDRAGRLEVWVMGRDGGDPTQITRVGATGHFLRWTRDGRFVLFTCPSGGVPRTLRVAADGLSEPEPLPPVKGGAHISLSPDETRILDVVGHKVLHVSPLGGGEPEAVFAFDDPSVRIDYPVWSPDGRWALFDRFRPEGGDVWVLEGIE